MTKKLEEAEEVGDKEVNVGVRVGRAGCEEGTDSQGDEESGEGGRQGEGAV